LSQTPQRILVIGSSCAGKSTFARSLSKRSNLPYTELDHLHWGPNWSAKHLDEFRALTDTASAGDQWVIEGNYSAVRDLLWSRANTVIWLNYSFPLVLWRAVRRTIHRSFTRQELWHGNRESLRQSFLSRESILVWVITTFRKRQKQFEALQSSGLFPHLAWIEFRSPAQAENFLRTGQHAG
jgi:adenylate kinase family enzyme